MLNTKSTHTCAATLVLVVIASLAIVPSTSGANSSSTTSHVHQDQVELMQQSLNDLMQELNFIKSEATNRLSSARQNRVASDERIRQTKVSKFILSKTSELEQESTGLKDELNQLFARVKRRQQQQQQQQQQQSGNSHHLYMPTVEQGADNEVESSTDKKPAKFGFDLEALKKLGDDIESQLEARANDQDSTTGGQPESLRRVHEQSIVFVDRLVQNYLTNLRRAIDRMTRIVDHRVPEASGIGMSGVRGGGGGNSRYKRDLENRLERLADDLNQLMGNTSGGDKQQLLTGRQINSPLVDRIPPRGTELWRDFWDTVRKQVRRINQEFRRITRDMGRLVTGQPRQLRLSEAEEEEASTGAVSVNRIDGSVKSNDISLEEQMENEQYERINVFDDQDDDFTRSELTRNVALRQQIQQEIGVFGSIFDMMQAFVRRLRETARNMVRDVLDPNGMPNNNNNAVTPGPDIKPQIDALLEETIEAQRNINGQARPVLLPNDRDRQRTGR